MHASQTPAALLPPGIDARATSGQAVRVRRTWGTATAGTPTAVLLPGAGSSADFVTRAFGPPLDQAGYALLTTDPVAGSGVVTAAAADLAAAVSRYRPQLVGGVSLGAHLAVRWAASTPNSSLEGLLLALPARTGPADPAAGSSSAAEAVRQRGAAAVVADIADRAVPWVADELAAAWPAYGPALAETLDAAAGAAAPYPDELRAVDVPVGLVAFLDDPLHPADVAQRWAALLPRAAVEWLRLADLATDRSRLGAAALHALRRAQASNR
jgi:pimeloyl-ACP methyl ester carboxylesterase